MKRIVLGLIVTGVLGLAGCNAMEQYHYQPAVAEVPTPIKMSFADKYPNEAIQWPQTVGQKMYDGSMRYDITALDAKNVAHTHVFMADGTEVK